MELEVIHLGILICTGISILYADHMAYQYFKGASQLLDMRITKRFHHAVWFGLFGMVVSGFFLFLPMASYLLGEPSFYLKIAFVLVLFFNAWVIGKISHVAYERPFANLTSQEKNVLILSGGASFFGWVAATLIGFFFL